MGDSARPSKFGSWFKEALELGAVTVGSYKRVWVYLDDTCVHHRVGMTVEETVPVVVWGAVPVRFDTSPANLECMADGQPNPRLSEYNKCTSRSKRDNAKHSEGTKCDDL